MSSEVRGPKTAPPWSLSLQGSRHESHHRVEDSVRRTQNTLPELRAQVSAPLGRFAQSLHWRRPMMLFAETLW